MVNTGRQLSDRQIAAIAWAANQELRHQLGEDPAPDWADLGEVHRSAHEVRVDAIARGAPDRVVHDSWSRHLRINGWVWGLVLDADNKIHPTMVDYGRLSSAQRTRDTMFRGIVTALVTNGHGSAGR